MSIPILLIGDSPDLPTGLGRICRDLAVGLATLPEFRVGVMGRGGRGSRQLPFQQYVIGEQGWGEDRFTEVRFDFAGIGPCVVMPIWDASRVRWLANYQDANLIKWLYPPIDASGPQNRLTGVLADTINKFHRVVAYGQWAHHLIERSTNHKCTWIPHGVNLDVWKPVDRAMARQIVGFQPHHKVIGMVASNQARKDWGVAFQVIRLLVERNPNVRFWAHSDTDIRHWNLPSLVQDYGLQQVVKLTYEGEMNDQRLNWMYNGCDMTILPSSEGYGYPLVESQAAGVPVLHTNYAGGAELVQNPYGLLDVGGYRLESVYNNIRPVHQPEEWVGRIEMMLEVEWEAEEVRRGVEHLGWSNLWPVWKRWMLEGIQ